MNEFPSGVAITRNSPFSGGLTWIWVLTYGGGKGYQSVWIYSETPEEANASQTRT